MKRKEVLRALITFMDFSVLRLKGFMAASTTMRLSKLDIESTDGQVNFDGPTRSMTSFLTCLSFYLDIGI